MFNKILIFVTVLPYNKYMKSKLGKAIMIAVSVIAACAVIGGIALCMVFPNKYSGELNAAADEFGLERRLVRSVVWAESKFDRKAVSDKGAVGLMQLMPQTLTSCAAALRIKDPDGFDPQTNLRCGCYYLSLLLEKFDGDESAALMAYNAGEANAKKFLDGDEVFPETQKYLKDVALAKHVYR